MAVELPKELYRICRRCTGNMDACKKRMLYINRCIYTYMQRSSIKQLNITGCEYRWVWGITYVYMRIHIYIYVYKYMYGCRGRQGLGLRLLGPR